MTAEAGAPLWRRQSFDHSEERCLLCCSTCPHGSDLPLVLLSDGSQVKIRVRDLSSALRVQPQEADHPTGRVAWDRDETRRSGEDELVADEALELDHRPARKWRAGTVRQAETASDHRRLSERRLRLRRRIGATPGAAADAPSCGGDRACEFVTQRRLNLLRRGLGERQTAWPFRGLAAPLVAPGWLAVEWPRRGRR